MNFLSGHITIGRLNHLSCHESRSYSFRSPLTFFRRICMRAVRNAHFRAHVCLNLHSKHFWSHRYADSVGCFFLDMHGLIFYLSISPLAGSTRYLGPTETVERNEGVSRSSTPEPPTFQPGRILMHEHRNFHKHPFKTVSRAQELEVNIKSLSRVRKTSDHVDH